MTPPRLIFQVMAAHRAVRRWIDARSGDTGVGAAGAGVLFHLAGREHALIGDVTAALDASPSGMSGLISRLEKAGLISRTTDPGDARAVRLALTAAGRRAVESAHGAVADLNAHLNAGFTPAELEVVSRWLTHATALRPDR